MNRIGSILRMLQKHHGETLRVYGKYYKEDNCIIFDCSSAVLMADQKKERADSGNKAEEKEPASLHELTKAADSRLPLFSRSEKPFVF